MGTIGVHGGAGGGSAGTPGDPSEVNIIEYGSVATTLGQKAKAASIPVTLASDQDALPVTDNGGSLTVDSTDLDIRNLAPATDTIAIGDGSATATIRNLAANDALNVAIVDGAGDQITSFGGGTQYTEGDVDATITGTAAMMEVAGNTLQPVQGTVADGLLVNLGANNDVTVTGTVSVTEPVSVDDNGGSLTVDNATLSVTGGGVEATALRVTLANDSTGLVSIDDNGGSLTVDGTVTANAGTNLNTSALNLETTQADVRTALQIIDDWDESDRAKVNPIAGQVGVQGGAGTVTALTQRVALATDANIVSTKTALTAASPAAVSVGTSSTLILAANASRKGAEIVNTSNATISLAFGVSAVLNSGKTLFPGGSFHMDEYDFNTSAINGIASAAASNVGVQEYT